MFRLFLERLFLGPSGLLTCGVPLRIGGQDRIVFAKPACVLSDGDGIRMCYDWKGAASLKPCWKHFNVVRKALGLKSPCVGQCDLDVFAVCSHSV